MKQNNFTIKKNKDDYFELYWIANEVKQSFADYNGYIGWYKTFEDAEEEIKLIISEYFT